MSFLSNYEVYNHTSFEENETLKTKTMKEKEELIQAGTLWDQAIVNNDAEAIGAFMSPDWVIVGTEGGITPRSTFLNLVKSGDLVHTQMDFEDMRVELYGNTGVVTSRGTSSGTYKEQPFSYYEWTTSVYIREEKWRCVLTMLTPAR
jgi:ketosteroid isomerase-like protein